MLYVNPLTANGSSRLSGEQLQQENRKTALQELEHFFAQTLLREMRKTVPKSSMFGDGHEMDTYQELLDDAMGTEMAKSGQLGIADMLDKQLRIEEMQQSIRAKLHGNGPALGQALEGVTESRNNWYMPINVTGPGLGGLDIR